MCFHFRTLLLPQLLQTKPYFSLWPNITHLGNGSIVDLCFLTNVVALYLNCYFPWQAFGDKRHRHRHDLHIFWSLQRASVLAYTCYVLHHALLHHHEEADQGKCTNWRIQPLVTLTLFSSHSELQTLQFNKTVFFGQHIAWDVFYQPDEQSLCQCISLDKLIKRRLKFL